MPNDLVVSGGGDQGRKYEIASSAAESMAHTEIQGAIAIAKRFPRDELSQAAKITKACKRPGLAAISQYTFPRGGKKVTGPSAPFAREIARMWSNMRWGCDIISDECGQIVLRAWAWDLENNNKVSADDSFKKLVQRKRDGATQWVEPDERDLRELINKRAATNVRNCLLQLIPKDVVEDAIKQCNLTLESGAKDDPEASKKAMVVAFASIGVTGEMLSEYLHHPVTVCSPKEIVELRTIYASIRDGNSAWPDYMAAASGATKHKPKTLDDLKNAMKKPEESDKPEFKSSAGPKLARSDQTAEIQQLAEEKCVTEDELKSIMIEYSDSMETLTEIGAGEVIAILRTLGDAR